MTGRLAGGASGGAKLEFTVRLAATASCPSPSGSSKNIVTAYSTDQGVTWSRLSTTIYYYNYRSGGTFSQVIKSTSFCSYLGSNTDHGPRTAIRLPERSFAYLYVPKHVLRCLTHTHTHTIIHTITHTPKVMACLAGN